MFIETENSEWRKSLCTSVCLSKNLVDRVLNNYALKYFGYFLKDNCILSRIKSYFPTITLCIVTDFFKKQC